MEFHDAHALYRGRLERVVDQGLSPSMSHPRTDPDVRSAMLRNPRGHELRWLRCLLDNGVEVHGRSSSARCERRGRVARDLAGVLDRFSELVTSPSCARREPLFQGPFMRPHAPRGDRDYRDRAGVAERFVRASGVGRLGFGRVLPARRRAATCAGDYEGSRNTRTV